VGRKWVQASGWVGANCEMGEPGHQQGLFPTDVMVPGPGIVMGSGTGGPSKQGSGGEVKVERRNPSGKGGIDDQGWFPTSTTPALNGSCVGCDDGLTSS
jgi:hypothetical protein